MDDGGKIAEATALMKEALASLDRAKQSVGWQPIETAPKDGSAILLTGQQECYRWPFVGRWAEVMPHSGVYEWVEHVTGLDALGMPYQPTYWMSVPEPPRPSERGEG